ncbi:unnamed protein product [Prorocentrum cordatum]|uniref:Uncharacterized protein n=1 Tax=Prorocentrum cordatum TaxID=2364126 RepID=A0ABN9TE94_9DINO|nr:unnamed protein product [Polarella glacialis]
MLRGFRSKFWLLLWYSRELAELVLKNNGADCLAFPSHCQSWMGANCTCSHSAKRGLCDPAGCQYSPATSMARDPRHCFFVPVIAIVILVHALSGIFATER